MIEFVFHNFYKKYIFFFFFYSLYFFKLKEKDGTTPLFVAVENGHEQIVQILLEKGKANVNFATKVLFC